MNDLRKVIAVIGGTGGLGSALAFRWGNAGYKVLIGSRDKEKASFSAEKLNGRLGKEVASGFNNKEAAKLAQIIVLTIPYQYHSACKRGGFPESGQAYPDGYTGRLWVEFSV